MHGEFQPEAGTPQEAHLKQIQQNADGMKKNIEATERLLKEFEEQIRKADEHVNS
jgi:predicted  nucleic acid-binding Zn-ribbon protein